MDADVHDTVEIDTFWNVKKNVEKKLITDGK